MESLWSVWYADTCGRRAGGARKLISIGSEANWYVTQRTAPATAYYALQTTTTHPPLAAHTPATFSCIFKPLYMLLL